MRLTGGGSADLMCRTVKGFGPVAMRAGSMPRPLAMHAASCLRCQRDLARYRRLRRELGRLAQPIDAAPMTIMPRVEQAIQPELALAPPPRHNARLAATIAGATAATAGGVYMRCGVERALWREWPGSAQRDLDFQPPTHILRPGSNAIRRGVARIGRAPVSKTGGCGFESHRPCWLNGRVCREPVAGEAVAG